jgi:hypothetical protein
MEGGREPGEAGGEWVCPEFPDIIGTVKVPDRPGQSLAAT